MEFDVDYKMSSKVLFHQVFLVIYLLFYLHKIATAMNLILDGNKTSYFFGFARFAYLPNTVNQQILECYYIWRIWRIAYIR